MSVKERLSHAPETPVDQRLARQVYLALFGTIILALSGLPWYAQTGGVGQVVLMIALLVTPGVAIGSALCRGRAQPAGFIIGFAVAASLAWYVMLIGSLFAFHQPLQPTSLALCTAALSFALIIASIIAGGRAFVVPRPRRVDLRSITAAGLSVVGVVAIAGGAYAVASQVPTGQPAGAFVSVTLPQQAAGTPYSVSQTGTILVSIRADAANTPVILSTVADDGSTSATVSKKASSKPTTAEVPVPPRFTGCHYLTVTAPGLSQPMRVLATTDQNAVCPSGAVVNVFKKFDIDPTSAGAPTTNLQAILKYLQEQAGKVDLTKLSPAYKQCLQLSDPTAVAQCVDRIDG